MERIKGETEVKGDRELEGIKGMYRREVRTNDECKVRKQVGREFSVISNT